MHPNSALFLSGSLGKGHDTLAEACASAIGRRGVKSSIVDCIPMMGRGPGLAADWIFRRILDIPPIYDAFHFSQLRAEGWLGRAADKASLKALFPPLRAVVAASDADLLISVFATAVPAVAKLKAERPELKTVVFMTDSFAHRMWVREHTDLFLVTSQMAAASVRRYWAQAEVRVINAPVRPEFYEVPTQSAARAGLGVPDDATCVLLISGAWGLGPLDDVAATLADAGYWVLAVAGTNAGLRRRLDDVAKSHSSVRSFGYTDRVHELMAAADVVVTSSGDTCREARVVGRGLVLLDVVPGHGRENLMHELELGQAAVCSPTAVSVLGTIRTFLRDHPPAQMHSAVLPEDWERELVEALGSADIEL